MSSIRVFALVLSLFVGACTGSTESARNIATGTYQHTMKSVAGTGGIPADYSGTLTITRATDSQLEGTWQVAGYSTTATGNWNVDAFRITADLLGKNAIAIFRISRDGDQIICNGTILVGGLSSATSYPSVCTFVGQ